MIRRSIVIAALGVAACSSPSDSTSPSSLDAGAADADPSFVEGGTIAQGDAAVDPVNDPVRFHIQFDYRFDTQGFFDDPSRRSALEGAGRIWGRLLSDSFDNIPSGTFVRVRDPEHPADPAQSFDIAYEIDDLVVFVGSSELSDGVTASSFPTAGLSGVTNAALQTSLDQRYHGTPFQPWTGWISFDRTQPWSFDSAPEVSKPLAPEGLDFVTVALHEIGHVLGFGTADTFNAAVTSLTFNGPKAMAVYGGPVPLADPGHFPNSLLTSGKRQLMDQSDAPGTRYLPTALDIAAFGDLGYHF